MKRRAFPDGVIDLVSVCRLFPGVMVRFHRHQESDGRIRKLTQDRLAADDDDFIVVCDFAAGANQMLKL